MDHGFGLEFGQTTEHVLNGRLLQGKFLLQDRGNGAGGMRPVTQQEYCAGDRIEEMNCLPLSVVDGEAVGYVRKGDTFSLLDIP